MEMIPQLPCHQDLTSIPAGIRLHTTSALVRCGGSNSTPYTNGLLGWYRNIKVNCVHAGSGDLESGPTHRIGQEVVIRCYLRGSELGE